MSDLNIPLKDLNTWLSESKIEIELVVIGAFAIHLHGYTNRMTMDIDTITALENDLVLSKIQELGKKYGIPRWLNNQALGLIMPVDYEKRLLVNSQFSHITLKYLARTDLVKLKVAAYFYRGEYEKKDFEDLNSISVTDKELNEAYDFLLNFHKPEINKFTLDFDERLNQIKKDLSL